jgi:hypothetical protein
MRDNHAQLWLILWLELWFRVSLPAKWSCVIFGDTISHPDGRPEVSNKSLGMGINARIGQSLIQRGHAVHAVSSRFDPRQNNPK